MLLDVLVEIIIRCSENLLYLPSVMVKYICMNTITIFIHMHKNFAGRERIIWNKQNQSNID